MKSVKIGELKNKLSAYLRIVRKGGEIIITDRDTPIAKLSPFQEQEEPAIIPAKKKSSGLFKIKPIGKPINISWEEVLKRLREDRDKR